MCRIPGCFLHGARPHSGRDPEPPHRRPPSQLSPFVSGEIIAGVEPVAATKRGIDRIVNAGAFPTVCIFRPTIGSDMESVPPPHPEAMMEVFAYLHDACRRAGLPIGVLPIEISLVVQARKPPI
jgi:hypothetical protein